MGKKIIKLEKIVKKFYIGEPNELEILHGISLEIEEGEFVSIVGPSGSGKSTLMNMIGALDRPTSGNYYLDGIDVEDSGDNELSEIRNAKIGFVFQDFRLLYDRTVAENIEFALRVIESSEREIKTQKKAVLEMVGLTGKENAYPNQLSGGEQQRVALARAMATRPPIIIADEPTGNLDPITAGEIFKTLNEINARGTTVLVVTHAKDIVDSMGKRVIALDHGKVVRDDQRGGY